MPGSPPQVRGKQVRTRTNAFCNRITPAGAGKTCLCWALRRNYWDHPRRCGENDRSHVKMRCCIGSPPQVRGKLGMAGFGIDTSRITPAGAGKTNCPARRARLAVDHPRRCGENMIPPCRLCVNTGSPPQVRGKRDTDGQTADVTGITPADAGKTTRQQMLRNVRTGSPPRMRGKPPGEGSVVTYSRITPADAGKTRVEPDYTYVA